MSSLYLDQTRHFLRLESLENVVSSCRIHHVVRIFLNEALDHINLLHGPLNSVFVVCRAAGESDPELAGKLALPNSGEISVARRYIPLGVQA